MSRSVTAENVVYLKTILTDPNLPLALKDTKAVMEGNSLTVFPSGYK